MITYVDTSTLLKLLVDEPGSEGAELIWETTDVLTAAALVVVEARAALAAAERARRLTTTQHRRAKTELGGLVDALTLVAISDDLIARAGDLAEQESLRGYDAVHLEAALTVGANVLTSSDTSLCEAAERRGLYVANPLDN